MTDQERVHVPFDGMKDGLPSAFTITNKQTIQIVNASSEMILTQSGSVSCDKALVSFRL